LKARKRKYVGQMKIAGRLNYSLAKSNIVGGYSPSPMIAVT